MSIYFTGKNGPIKANNSSGDSTQPNNASEITCFKHQDLSTVPAVQDGKDAKSAVQDFTLTSVDGSRRDAAAFSINSAQSELNSDLIVLNQGEHNPKGQLRLMAILEDGVTGNEIAQENNLGRYAAHTIAKAFVDKLPEKTQNYLYGSADTVKKIAIDIFNETLTEEKEPFEAKFAHLKSKISNRDGMANFTRSQTTFVGALEDRDNIYLLNIGDSTGFLISNQGIIPGAETIKSSGAFMGSQIGFLLDQENVFATNKFNPIDSVLSITTIKKSDIEKIKKSGSYVYLLLASDGLFSASNNHKRSKEALIEKVIAANPRNANELCHTAYAFCDLGHDISDDRSLTAIKL